MSETSVCSDLLQSFQVFSELGINTVGDELRPGALTDVPLSVQEPLGNVVIGGLSDNVVDLFDVSFNKLTSSLVEVDLGNLEHEVSESAANTLDGSEGEHGLASTVDVGVLNTENVDEFFCLNELDTRLIS